MSAISSIKAILPWQLKIVSKLLLSRLPVQYKIWQQLDLFKPGGMEMPSYAYDEFCRHFSQLGRQEKNLSFLELGPGDSLASALIAYAFDAKACHLIDVGRFATEEIETYREMAQYLRQLGLKTPEMAAIHSVYEMLAACNAHYGTKGIDSIKSIPEGSIDFIWSHAVLEHVRKQDFLRTFQELRRVIKKDGVCSHTVDLRDHLSGGLNNLRFSSRFWELDGIAQSGFYTNRIDYRSMLKLFNTAGFATEVVEIQKWKKVPILRSKLAEEFQHLSDEDLSISGFSVVLRPR